MTRTSWSRNISLAVAGVFVAFVGLALAGSLGHCLALKAGIPMQWFEVDFDHHNALILAVFLETLSICAAYFVLGCLSRMIGEISKVSLWAAANPVVGAVSFFIYKALKPFGPEHAYYAPINLLALVIAFPLFMLAACIGLNAPWPSRQAK